jgi:hypothetical protein
MFLSWVGEHCKKAWDSHLKYALWAYRISTKRLIGTSPFHLVYGIDVVFLIHLGLSVMKLLQYAEDEPSDMQRRINQLIEVQKTRESV